MNTNLKNMLLNIRKLQLGLLLIFSSMTSWAQHSTEVVREAFFAQLPFWESPYVPFKGACPITAEEAAKRIHLKFDFDGKNRIVAVHVKLGDHYKEFEGFFGNLFINAPLTKVAYEGDRERHSFFDRFGNQLDVQGKVHQKIYEKDVWGRNTKLRFLDRNGQLTVDMFGVQEYHWQHQPDGSIIEERLDKEGNLVPLRGDFELLRTKMIFDDQGYFRTLQNVDEAGKLKNTEGGVAAYHYYYDEQGRFHRWEVYDADGHKTIGPSNTAGEQNEHAQYDLKEIVFFDDQGNPTKHWSGAERWHFEVDRFGNRVALEFQDASGKPINANANYAKRCWEWSDDGRFLISESYYDKGGQPVDHAQRGFHKIVFERDGNGVVLRTKRYDNRNQPLSDAN